MSKTLFGSRLVFLLHTLFWIGFFFIYFSIASRFEIAQARVASLTIPDTLIMGILTYLNTLLFLPRFLKTGNYGRYMIFTLMTILILVALRLALFAWFFEEPIPDVEVGRVIFGGLFPLIGFYFISTTGWFVVDWFQSRRRETELANLQLDTELKLLKLQLSPHFLFNTLNNIYSLAYFGDKNTAEAVMKLSSMMRHMIYDSQDTLVPLIKEIEFIENFIQLQKLKMDNSTSISFTKKGIKEHHLIAPMIFVVFLENAFKHGKLNSSSIAIGLNVTDADMLSFSIDNEILKKESETFEKSEIGLNNVRKRLQLIYQDRHQLNIQSDETHFNVRLNLDLS